jgi:hypothetical protein
MGEIERETRYLDLDGDGVPDATETIEVRRQSVDVGGHHTTVTEVVDEIDSEIGVDGEPGEVQVSDTIVIEDVSDEAPNP